MFNIEVYLPAKQEPVDLDQFVDFVVEGGATRDDTLCPDYLSYARPGYEIEAVKD